jgi:hypothetical protein
MPGISLESELSKPPKRKARFTIFSAMTWNDRHRFARKGRHAEESKAWLKEHGQMLEE